MGNLEDAFKNLSVGTPSRLEERARGAALSPFVIASVVRSLRTESTPKGEP